MALDDVSFEVRNINGLFIFLRLHACNNINIIKVNELENMRGSKED